MVKLEQSKKISFSKFNVLMKCGYGFYMSYVQFLEREPVAPGALYGSTLHQLFEDWFNKGMPDGSSWLETNVFNYYEKQKEEKALGTITDKKDTEIRKDLAPSVVNLHKMLKDNNQLTAKTKPEIEIIHSDSGYLVHAKIDYLSIINRTSAKITDAKGYKKVEHIDKEQIVLYGYLIHKTLGISNFTDSGYFCFYPKINSFYNIDIKIADGKRYFDYMLSEYHERTTKEIYHPNPSFSNCMLCNVYSHCKYRHFVPFKEKKEEPAILKVSNKKTSL